MEYIRWTTACFSVVCYRDVKRGMSQETAMEQDKAFTDYREQGDDLLLNPVYTIQPVVRLYRVNKHPTGCQTGLYIRFDKHGLTTGWMNSAVRSTRLSNRLYNPVWQPAVYTIQPFVKPVWLPVWQRVWQPVVSCKRGFTVTWFFHTLRAVPVELFMLEYSFEHLSSIRATRNYRN